MSEVTMISGPLPETNAAGGHVVVRVSCGSSRLPICRNVSRKAGRCSAGWVWGISEIVWRTRNRGLCSESGRCHREQSTRLFQFGDGAVKSPLHSDCHIEL